MKKLLLLSVALLLVFSAYSGEIKELSNKKEFSTKRYSAYVNPFVGTDFHGHTFPGATYPFGMVQLSPDTRLSGWDGCSGYHYSDSEIYGFSHTHLSGTGVADYCDILLMPVSGYQGDEIINEEYKSPFAKSSEKASPGLYEVFLEKWGVKVELTAGKRVGFHKYTYTPGKSRQVVLDLAHRDQLIEWNVEIATNYAIKGYRRSKAWASDQVVYFYIQFSEPYVKVKMRETKRKVLIEFESDVMNLSGKQISASGVQKRYKPIMAKVGISSVSTDNAKLNLDAECAAWDFDGLKKSTEEAWNKYLGKIEVEGGSEEQLKTFYTALYHSAIAPNLLSDVNGEYRGMDRRIHKAEGYDHYTVFSLWDTYRTLHPLMTIIERERTVHFVKSMLAMFREGGKLPIWELAGNETNCMIGYHSVSVITDALMKGIGGKAGSAIDKRGGEIDKREALNAMVESSRKDEFGIREYMKQGFLSADLEHESVSKTLEYAYDDWCIALLAKELGEIEIYNEYFRRAQSWKNISDPETGFMRPRVNGGWLTPFEPSEVNVHFTEANSWQYSFYVPHDIETHIEMLGGDEAYIAKLDGLFSAPVKTSGRTQVDITGLIGQYAHGNEPSHHTAYLYNFAGAPWRTQEMVRRIMNELYSSAPDGLSGNDDCGQMSAWYVMSALGFYPVTPGDPIYVIGSPLFKSARINLENGKSFTVKSGGDIYIHSAKLNDKEYTKSWLSHKDIEKGGELVLSTAPTPSNTFGVAKSDRPSSKMCSATPDSKTDCGEGAINFGPMIPLVPWFRVSDYIFKDSSLVELATRENKISGDNKQTGDKLFWRAKTDNSQENIEDIPFQEYNKPIKIKQSVVLEGYSLNSEGVKSPYVTCSLRKINSEWKITLHSKYNPQYNAGGDDGLIDGVRGKKNYRLGGWQGYQNRDFTAIVDFGKTLILSKVGAGFLQDARSWIWMPRYVEFYISDNGTDFTLLGRVENTVGEKDLELQIQDLVLNLNGGVIATDNSGVQVTTGKVDQKTTARIPHSGRYLKIFAKNFGSIPQWHEGAGGEGFIFIDEIFVN